MIKSQDSYGVSHTLGINLHEAIEELQCTENLFNFCEPHQFEYANAKLTVAQEKVNIAVREAKKMLGK